MTRKMADAVNPFNIPVGVYPLVAGYINGPISQWPAAGWARHAGHSILVRITVTAAVNDGHVLDVEKGDATPTQAPPWVKMRRAAGADPTVYCSEAAWPAVRQAFIDAKVPQPHYWVAAYPGEGASVIPAGAIAHQYVDLGPLDESIVENPWPGVDTEVDVQITDPVPTNPVPGSVGAALNDVLYGQDGVRPAGQLALDMFTVKTQLAALAGALPAEHAEVLAAIQAVPVAQVDPAALEAAGLPQQIVAALLAAISKAATPAAPAITTGGSPA
jgi:hypothetical protein